MARTIIVSDLHVDTWDDRQYGQGQRCKTKLQHWCDFLDWCARKQIDELVINGDLMDAPPYQGNVSFTSQIARQAVEKLLAYAGGHRVTYVYGNHDTGISGLRCAAGDGLSALHNINLVYPDYVIPTAGSVLLIQHGHLFDPVLLLYLRDLSVRTYLTSNLQAFQWVQQRRDGSTGQPIKPPGVASPAAVNLGPDADNNVYYAIKLAEELSPTAQPEISAARRFLGQLRRGVVSKVGASVKHYLWWEAAKRVCADYLHQPQPGQGTVYCLMGHTHVPDTAEAKIEGRRCIYLNSGTWTGTGDNVQDRQHATYLDVDATGKVWIQDWITESEELRRLEVR